MTRSVADTVPAGLINLLEQAGHAMTDCPVLVPAATMLDLVGPLTRGRLYLTSGIGGSEFCLRPEFTIAIAQAHIRNGDPNRTARYGYCGPVFRKRPTGTGEFLQAGAEAIGDADRAQADADMVLLAWRACRQFGVEPASVFGDEALFRAVLAALAVPPLWQRRLHAAFGDRDRVERTLAQMETGGSKTTDGVHALAGLGRIDAETATAVVEQLIEAGEGSAGVRSAADIAARLVEKTQLKDDADTAGKAATIRSYLAIDCALEQAAGEVDRFGRDHGVDLQAELDAFSRRTRLIAAEQGNLAGIRFQAAFGRLLDYYTGFIFDIFDRRRPDAGPVCGGGRYDGLAARLGADAPVPAVGFSLWLDRLLAGSAP